jgi:flagellar hook assembly protein FlgD
LDEDIPKLGEKYNIPIENNVTTESRANSLKIFPNPSSSIINFLVSQSADGPLFLDLFNILGENVFSLQNHFSEKGEYTATWNGRDSNGHKVVSGVYFVVMKLNYEVVKTSKFIVIN